MSDAVIGPAKHVSINKLTAYFLRLGSAAVGLIAFPILQPAWVMVR
jgi:hypothetical protein